MVDRGLAKFQQAFGKDAAAGAGHDLTNDAVHFPGPDIIGPDAEHVAGDVIQHMPYQRHHVLVGRGADINHIVAALKALISRRMPEQPLGALDDRNDLLARGRGVAADDMIDLHLTNKIGACRMVTGDPATTPPGSRRCGAKVKSNASLSLISSTAINALLRISPAIMA